jgi:hypothetical protein
MAKGIWFCKIGQVAREDVPQAGDGPMRDAVERAYKRTTGHDPQFSFSGWSAELTESERAAVEDRLPDLDVMEAEARATLAMLERERQAQAQAQSWRGPHA